MYLMTALGHSVVHSINMCIYNTANEGVCVCVCVCPECVIQMKVAQM